MQTPVPAGIVRKSTTGMEPMFFFFYAPSDPLHLRIAADMHDGAYDVMPDVSIATMRTFLKVAAKSADEPSAKILAERAGLPYSKFMRHIEVLAEGSRRLPGHQVLTKTYNSDLRRHEIHVTLKGQHLLSSITKPIAEAVSE